MPDNHSSQPPSCELRFVDGSSDSFLNALAEIPAGQAKCRVWLVPSASDPTLAEEILKHAPPGFSLRVAPPDTTTPFSLPDDFSPDIALLLENNPEILSLQLINFVDIPGILVIAPLTSHHWSKRPLYLISIPKSGTHLLYELANAFGYWQGINCVHEAQPAHWYCIEYSNSHTVAKDFFVDTVRRQAFGNRHHPFMRAPALFIYRNPLDVLVSEANYYHLPGKTSFAAYLDKRSFTERLEVLLGNDWLLGSLRERIGGFIPWLHFANVAALSFEELIGNHGGGDDELQAMAIWSLQLKLHIPGRPSDYTRKLFNRDSATFNEGRIGSFAEKIPARTLARFFGLPQDFMHELGYSRPPGMLRGLLNRVLRHVAPRLLARREIAKTPAFTAELRKRPLTCSGDVFNETPITLETDYLGYNIIRLRGRFLGVPQKLGPIDLAERFDSLPDKIISENTEGWVKFRIMQRLNR